MNADGGLLARVARLGVNAAAVLVVATMFAIVFNAVLRYFFGGGIHVIIEISGFIFLWLIFLGVAYTFLAGGHVTVELLTDALSERKRLLLSRFLIPLLGIVYVAMIGWASLVELRDLFESGETSIGTERFPLWMVLVIMPVGCLLLLLALLNTLLGRKGPAE